jgi:fructose-bisphosphate aldolase class II
MPIATPEAYAEMLDKAKRDSFAFPAINVSSSQTLNAALKGFADAGSDGIIQVSTGGADYLSGPSIKNMVSGSVAFASYAVEVAKNYPVNVALHTDHCPQDKLDGFVRPLLDISVERVKNGQDPLFQSHMWDGSAWWAARRTASWVVPATSSTAPRTTRSPRWRRSAPVRRGAT